MGKTTKDNRKNRNEKGIAQSRASNAVMLSLFQYHRYIIARSKDGDKLRGMWGRSIQGSEGEHGADNGCTNALYSRGNAAHVIG